ncbi:MAG: hypothetical protein K6G34_08885, partial [Lachnospiraceae bacterium]|nr:hypothetical protein [Lachnospiraceae bacterium]
EKYKHIIEIYASKFQQFGCDIQITRYWESWRFFHIHYSYKRVLMNVGYHFYAIVEVVKDGNCIEVFNEMEEIREPLFSKRLVSCISRCRNSRNLELYVISDYSLEDELNELKEDLAWFLNLMYLYEKHIH